MVAAMLSMLSVEYGMVRALSSDITNTDRGAYSTGAASSAAFTAACSAAVTFLALVFLGAFALTLATDSGDTSLD